ncbi:MAG: hypothetical protein H0T76_16415 [Nannocystis sp.]|nr:hypothetical protein [Nannocystis sp.]MBA3548066.1 hypothetical protein [Nannocystis sp.]
MSLDALGLIVADLRAGRQARVRYFMPALVLALLLVGGFLVLEGLRPDLWRQPLGQLGAQLAVWLLCLVAMPAVGLGLWFPARSLRIVLVIAAIAAAAVAALGQDLWAILTGGGVPGQGPRLDYCLGATVGAGFVLLALGVLSGAFAARRRASSALWVSGGMSLMAFVVSVWHCPSADPGHNLYSHLGAALLLMLLASGAGLIAHHRQRQR